MLSIAWKDLQILARDRNALIGAFLLPIVFIVVYLGVAGATTRDTATSGDADGAGADASERVALMVVDLDAGGGASAALLERLRAEAGLDPRVYADPAAARIRRRRRSPGWTRRRSTGSCSSRPGSAPTSRRVVPRRSASSAPRWTRARAAP